MTTYQAIVEARTLQRRSVAAGAFTSARWMISAAVIAAVAIAYVLLPQEIVHSVYNPMGASALVAFFTGVGRVGNRRIWRLLGSGVVSYATADLLGTTGAITTSMTGLLYLGAYALLATGLAAVVGTVKNGRR